MRLSTHDNNIELKLNRDTFIISRQKIETHIKANYDSNIQDINNIEEEELLRIIYPFYMGYITEEYINKNLEDKDFLLSFFDLFKEPNLGLYILYGTTTEDNLKEWSKNDYLILVENYIKNKLIELDSFFYYIPNYTSFLETKSK